MCWANSLSRLLRSSCRSCCASSASTWPSLTLSPGRTDVCWMNPSEAATSARCTEPSSRVGALMLYGTGTNNTKTRNSRMPASAILKGNSPGVVKRVHCRTSHRRMRATADISLSDLSTSTGPTRLTICSQRAISALLKSCSAERSSVTAPTIAPRLTIGIEQTEPPLLLLRRSSACASVIRGGACAAGMEMVAA